MFGSSGKRRGVTLIEIVIVIAIMGILGGIVLAAFWGRQDREILAASVTEALSLLEEARSRTISSKNFAQHGVHIEADRLVLFEGASYSPSSPSNETSVMNSKVAIGSVSLAGGGTDIVFTKVEGTTLQPGTFAVSLADGTASTTIRIHGTGIIETE